MEPELSEPDQCRENIVNSVLLGLLLSAIATAAGNGDSRLPYILIAVNVLPVTGIVYFLIRLRRAIIEEAMEALEAL
jgi:hypothetical protein